MTYFKPFIETSGGEVSVIELPYKGKTFTVQQSWPRNKWFVAIEPSFNGLNTADYDTAVEAIAAAKAIVDEDRSE